MNSVASHMIPISELADTLSFGLVAKLRKKAHNIDDIVQLHANSSDDNNNSKSIDNSITLRRNISCLQKAKKSNHSFTSDAFSPEHLSSSENIITAAYNFNDSILIGNNKRRNHNNSSYSSASSSPASPASLSSSYKSISMSYPPIHSNQQQQQQPLKRSFTTTATSTKSRKPLTSSLSPSSTTIPTQPSNLVKRVTISDNTVDIVSGQKYVRNSDYHYTVNPNYGQTNDDTSSISSLNDPNQEYKFVLDDHIFPGRSETYSSISSQNTPTMTDSENVITVQQKRRTNTN